MSAKKHLGNPALEVYSVLVHNEGQKPLDLYGAIKIRDAANITHSIYERERENPERVPAETKGYSLFIGAPELLDAHADSEFQFDLKHRNEKIDSGDGFVKLTSNLALDKESKAAPDEESKAVPDEENKAVPDEENRATSNEEKKAALDEENKAAADEEVCKGEFFRYTHYLFPMPVGKLYTDKLAGKDCTVEFRCALFERSSTARVIVTLIDPREDPIKVHGRITCRTSLVPEAARELFRKKPKSGIDVAGCCGPIELCSSLVVASLDTILFVSADLWDCYDDRVVVPIGSGTVDFLVKRQGTSTKVISGEYCDIKVVIFWRSWYSCY